MGFMDVLAMFFMLSALQPLMRQWLLETARRRLLEKLEQQRGSRVILLVHRQETMSILGFPVMRYIDVNDSEEILRAIHLTDEEVPIDLILQTPGGLVLASLQIARALKAHKGKVTVFVPHYAMSGGTLIALAADEIVMCPHAVLGPVDPQLAGMPAASILAAVERKPVEKVDDQTLILADQSAKAIEQVERSVKELLEGRYPEDRCKELARLLATGTWTHDHPITCDDARNMGLDVSTEMPELILALMSLYSQPVRQNSSVEYLPVRKSSIRGS